MKDADRLILATDPDREGEAISWHVLEVLEARSVREGQAGRARRLQRHHQAGGAGGDAPIRARSTSRWSTPISPAARSTISSASRSRRCSGASCRAPARPAACSRWRCAWSATAKPRSSASGRRNTGRSSRISARRAAESFTARLVGFDGKKLDKLDIPNAGAGATPSKRACWKAASSPSRRSKQAAAAQPAAALHHLDAAAGSPAQARLLDAAAPCRSPSASMRASISAARRSASSPICAPTASRSRRRRSPLRARDRARSSASATCRTKPRRYHDQGQERPGSARGDPPDRLRPPARRRRAVLDADQARLYELIWKRTIASQMAAAELERTTVDIDAATGAANATGSAPPARSIRFDGFLDALPGRPRRRGGRGRRPPAADAERGERLEREQIDADQHFTEPPPRYTEAIADQEDGGARHRPALDLCRDAERAARARLCAPRQEAAHAGGQGPAVTAFLESFFERYVEYDFTADLEEKLDRISAGELAWKDVLRDFWRDFSAAVDDDQGAARRRGARCAERDPRRRISSRARRWRRPAQLPVLRQRPLSLKLGKFGAFIGCSNYPECRFTRQLARQRRERRRRRRRRATVLGIDPETGLAGHAAHRPLRPLCPARRAGEGEKPKRASIPKGWTPTSIDLETALKLLSPAARGRPSSGDRQADRRRHRPLRTVRLARRQIRQSRQRRGGLHGRPQPRRLAAGRKARRAAARAAAAPRR